MSETRLIRCPSRGVTNRVPLEKVQGGIRSLPTLLVLKGGREVDRIVGVQPKSEIARRIERAIG
jgi:hypothetical protein